MAYNSNRNANENSLQPHDKPGHNLKMLQGLVFTYFPYIVLFIVIIIMGITLPYFLTSRNILNVLRQASSLAVMAMGITIVLIAGGLDISIPAIMAFSGIVGATYMVNGGSPILGMIIMLITGTLLGTINGFAVAYLNMVPFVVTLSMQAVVTGASVWLTRNISVSGLPIKYINIFTNKFLGIPNPIIFVAIGAVLLWLVMKRSVPGRWLYSTGINIKTSNVSGIRGNLVVFSSYLLSGLMAGFAAILITARLESASPTMGEEGVVLNVMGAAVVGGASIYGGIGSPIGAVIGAIIITLITNGMNMMHISYHNTLIVKGFVIIFFVAFDSLKRKVKVVKV